jgi:predicted AAA+ superfamily ATPase
MAFISGPRQVGKTTLSKQLAHSFSQSQYLTWDNPKIRKQWINDPTFFLAEFNHNKPA